MQRSSAWFCQRQESLCQQCAIRAVGHLHDAAEDVRLRVQVGEVSSEAARLVDYIDVEHLAKLNDFEKKEIHFMQKQCGIPVTKLDAFASTYGRTSKSGSKL